MEGRVPGGRKKSLSGDEEFSEGEEDRETPSSAPLSASDHSHSVPSSPKAPVTDHVKKKKIRAPSFRKFGSLMHKVVQQVSQASLHQTSPKFQRSKVPGDVNNIKSSTSTQSHSASDSLTNGDSSAKEQIVFDQTRTPGVVGIRNHGNTCFLNAVLQCLNNSDLLVRYFVLDQYKLDIKRNNKQNAKKYGTKGELTEHLAILLKSLWTLKYSHEISSEFKSIVGKYGSQYRGYAQHDAQEFLMWLLDKVHEDLNIATKKKYRANKSSHGRSDEAVAQEALANHARCNNSAVYGFFQGLCRSSLTCPNCRRQSITFDPILSLSLPIPQKTKRPVYVTVVYYDARPKQVRIGLLMNETDSVKDLRHTLAMDTKIQESQLILTEIYYDGFHRTFHDSQQLTDIHESDNIYAIQTPPPLIVANKLMEENEHLTLVVLNKQGVGDQGRRFGGVIVLRVARDRSLPDLQNDLLQSMNHMLRTDGIIAQKMGVLFRLHVVDGLAGMRYLPNDVDLPLYMPTVDRALSLCVPGGGPQHLKVMVEWDQHTKQCMIGSGDELSEEHESVQQVKLAHQQPLLGTLDECLQLYMQEERLGMDNAWLCPNCHKRQQGTIKALSLWSLPEVLVIHLKRFKQDNVKRTKLNTLITFPVTNLDMSHHIFRQQSSKAIGQTWSPWRSQKKIGGLVDSSCYDLFAVCNHYGNMQGGHYTAFCKNPTSHQWYCFDDTKVTPIQEGDVVTRAAYILFYQRKSSEQVMDISDPGHWIHKLGQVTYQPSRVPPVSKSHEDLLDGGDAEVIEEEVEDQSAFSHGVEAYATLRTPSHRTSPPAANASHSSTLPSNLNPSIAASEDLPSAVAVARSATSSSLTGVGSPPTTASPSPSSVRPIRKAATGQTGVIRQRSKETIIDEEWAGDAGCSSTLSTPVHRTAAAQTGISTSTTVHYYTMRGSTGRGKASLTRSMTSPEVAASSATPVISPRQRNGVAAETITRRPSAADKKEPLQEWDYKRSNIFLQESSV